MNTPHDFDLGTRERLIIVEGEVRHMGKEVTELKDSLKEIDEKLDRILLRSSPPPSKSSSQIAKVGQQGLGGALVALVIWAIQQLTGVPLALGNQGQKDTTHEVGK